MYNVKGYSNAVKGLLEFTDGVKVNTSGPIRKVTIRGELYVVGKGLLIPCENEQEAADFMADWK